MTSFTADATRRFTVREGAARDMERIAPLFDAYRQFYGAASDLAAALAFLETRRARGESVLLLASALAPGESDRSSGATPEPIVGFAQLYPSFSSVSMAPISILNDLFVLPEWRRSGVARTLVHASAAHASQRGSIRLSLSTQHTNRSARRLYVSLGFAPDLEFTHLSLDLPTVVRA